MPLFTLGYEGLGLDTYIQILLDNGVESLLDVRQRPQSRKPGFSKTALAKACAEHGIAYRHLAAFGCPLPIRNTYREDGDWARYTASYLAHLEVPELKRAVANLASSTWNERSCLTCFEADENFCHRLFVARAIEAAGGPEGEHLSRSSLLSDLSELALAGR